jgi:hypothetical protein
MNKALKLIKKFCKLEIRDKTRAIQKLINFEIYPQYIRNNFFDKLKYNFFFFFTLREKIKILKKYYKEEFKLKKNQRLNLITTFPRSGTNYINSVISSYYDINLKIGNGDVFYNGLLDSYVNSSHFLDKKLDLHNGIIFDMPYEFYKFRYKDMYKKEILGAGHFPLGDINTIFVQNSKFVVLIRKKIEKSISSWYVMQKKNEIKINQKLIDYSFLDSIIKNYSFFNNFWRENKLELKYKFVYYEDFIENPFLEFSKIFSFFQLSLNVDDLKKAINCNDKNNINQKIVKKTSDRQTDIFFSSYRLELEKIINEKLIKQSKL